MEVELIVQDWVKLKRGAGNALSRSLGIGQGYHARRGPATRLWGTGPGRASPSYRVFGRSENAGT